MQREALAALQPSHQDSASLCPHLLAHLLPVQGLLQRLPLQPCNSHGAILYLHMEHLPFSAPFCGCGRYRHIMQDSCLVHPFRQVSESSSAHIFRASVTVCTLDHCVVMLGMP